MLFEAVAAGVGCTNIWSCGFIRGLALLLLQMLSRCIFAELCFITGKQTWWIKPPHTVSDHLTCFTLIDSDCLTSCYSALNCFTSPHIASNRLVSSHTASHCFKHPFISLQHMFVCKKYIPNIDLFRLCF